MRVYDRDLIRGGHYGQRSCEPHLQAEHMAAPTNAAKREESSCQLGAVHTWLHRPMLQNVKKALANSEPSTHGHKADMRLECAPNGGQF
jgi:hypothetical protein